MIMNSPKPQIGSPGPFEVHFDDLCPDEVSSPTDNPTTIDSTAPRRRHECSSYDRCLELAAALNWESFTCRGCSGQINDTLRWRAGQAIRRDTIAKAICAAPKISTLSGKCAHVSISEEPNGPQREHARSLCAAEKLPRPIPRRLD